MFNLEKAHMILDEMVANGVVFDANKVGSKLSEVSCYIESSAA